MLPKKVLVQFVDILSKSTLDFVMLLQEFQNHDNIVRLLDMLPATNDMDIYLVFDYMRKSALGV